MTDQNRNLTDAEIREKEERERSMAQNQEGGGNYQGSTAEREKREREGWQGGEGGGNRPA